jgi:hypothetical protein
VKYLDEIVCLGGVFQDAGCDAALADYSSFPLGELFTSMHSRRDSSAVFVRRAEHRGAKPIAIQKLEPTI